MPVCTKCNIDKPQDQYYVEERWGKLYYKKYCLDCFRKQSRDWKARNKLKKQQMIDIPQQEEIIQPVVPELKPDVLDDMEGKVCYDCGEWKPLSQFHKQTQKTKTYTYRNCKPCYSKKQNKGMLDRDPFTSLYRPKPNEYYNEYQKEKVFDVMKALGWIFDEATGVWNKPGLKENGIFLNVIPDKKIIRKKTYHGNTPVKHNRLMANMEQILKYREEGHTFEELEDIYGCSHTTIRRAVKEYKYEQSRRSN